ncbi:MAG: TlpA family protein disulfide reductase, partial [Acidimicrobiales bacterium]
DVPFATFEGGTRTLAEYSGQPLVLNFFAAWCPSCVSEMPDFEAVHQELGDEVAFIGMSQDFDPADALALVEATGVTYDLGWDPDLALYGEFGGFAMPTTVFVSADGEVVEVFAGALTADALRAKIAGIGA